MRRPEGLEEALRVGSVLLPVAAENAGARTVTAPGSGEVLPINQNLLKFREKRDETITGRSTAVDAVINWMPMRCGVRSCCGEPPGTAGLLDPHHHPDLHQRRPGADGAGGGEVVKGRDRPMCFLVSLLPYNLTIGELCGNHMII